MRKKCKCESFHNVIRTWDDDINHAADMDIVDGFDYQTFCPLCGHIIYVDVPEHIQENQHIRFVKALANKIGRNEKDSLVFHSFSPVMLHLQ